MAKDDADNLRADIDGGYVRVAYLLSEALCCAPLTGTEHAVCHFIMRRTYGWARHSDRETGKTVPLTADLIATGTSNPRGTVHRAIANLVQAKVIVAESLGANHYSYGMNPEVGKWGLGDVNWKAAKVALQDNRDRGIYGGESSRALYAKMRKPLRKNAQTSTQKCAEQGALNACDTGPQGTSTESLYRESLESLSETAADGASDALAQATALKAERKLQAATRQLQQDARLQAALAALTDTDRAILDAMFAGQEQQRGKPLTTLQQAEQAETYARELAEHGPECWRDCCHIAIEREKYAVVYARGCTKNWQRDDRPRPAMTYGDPVLSAFVAAHGQKPQDGFAAQCWNQDLAEYRKHHQEGVA